MQEDTKFLVGDKKALYFDGKQHTVQEYLEHYWRRSQSVLLSVDRKRYQHVLQPTFLLVLKEIFLFALRNSPSLPSEQPKQDQRGELQRSSRARLEISPRYVYRRLAYSRRTLRHGNVEGPPSDPISKFITMLSSYRSKI